jgi:alkylation response protein AidB-like acyl-CoA dehydrogenase
MMGRIRQHSTLERGEVDFKLNKEQVDIQKAAGEFAKGEFDPELVLEHDKNHRFPGSIWKKASELGFLGVQYPAEFGGQALGLLEYVLVMEAFCRQDSGVGIALGLSDFGADLIMSQGSDDQKKEILPALAQGKALLALGLLEDGYALAPLKVFAKEEPPGYAVNGIKSSVPLGDLAQHILLACQTGPDDPPTQSLFLVKREAPGLECRPGGETLGMRMVPISRLVFDNLIVPERNLVGGKDQGHAYIKDFLNTMRIKCGAMAVGTAQGSLDRAVDYGRKREQFGRPIVSFDLIRNMIADTILSVEAARLVVYKAAWSMDQGKPDRRFILMSKVAGARAACDAANHAVQILGGYGYMTEGHVEHFYRDAKALALFLEPPQAEKDMLVEHVVGPSRGVAASE